jgi:cysteine-S-conjugate beta-lyase
MTHHIDTSLVHIGSGAFDPITQTAAVSLPAVRTSTVRFKNLEVLEAAQTQRAQGLRPVMYGISGLETHRALEEVFNTLEGGNYCMLSPSGLASIHLLFMSTLQTGDHALVSDGVYGPMRAFDQDLLKGLGREVSYFSPNHDDLESLIRPNTKLIYVESPSSLLFEMLDLPALSRVAKHHNIPLAIDNTWGSSHIYKPLALGADISLVAGTKYIAGHSDLLMGALITNRDDLATRIHRTQYAMGNSVSADDVWLALRGVRTIAVRMPHHAQSALSVCAFLAAHPKVVRIYHPAWPKDPGYGLWQRDCSGSNGMLSVEFNCTAEQLKPVVNALTLFGIGFSWGGFESLVQWVNPSALTPHQTWQGQDHGVLRLHIGLESIDDLIADLKQALTCISK